MREMVMQQLMELREEEYAVFQRKLLPELPPESILGVRAPALRKLAGTLMEDDFAGITYQYFEEKLLRAYHIAREKDFERCIAKVEAFLPVVDNWAVCDQLRPPVFRQEKERLLPYLKRWLDSGKTYPCRFAIVMLMVHFLREDFRPEYPEWVSNVQSEEYYVNMAIAWYFVTALCFRWEETLPFLEERRLSPWVHNKAIQKARESRMISAEKKEYLQKMKRLQGRAGATENPFGSA